MYPAPLMIRNQNNFYIPAKNARATITAMNPKTIPIATMVSCSSTELIFFIIFNLVLTIKLRFERKIGKKPYD